MADLTAAWSQYLVKGVKTRKVFGISSFIILLSTALEITPPLFNVQIHTYNKEWMISKALDCFIMTRKQGTEFNIVILQGCCWQYCYLRLQKPSLSCLIYGICNIQIDTPSNKGMISEILVTLSGMLLQGRCGRG
ncbi:hypothetical protein ES319_D06G103100v1 [Gossypium barbadense]|uniref:Uncharacterized protein n=1 Tax=Gossypium barbadense TaxID=3634 RepID=A0A5J5R1Q5_GOSBA|nr:hypothetical protein ES319_D06G103100v1 [Gossypium barbadense]